MPRLVVLMMLILGAMNSHKSFVRTASIHGLPTDQGGIGSIDSHSVGNHPPVQDAEVQELENLKQPGEKENPKVFSESVSSIATNENGKQEYHEIKKIVDENGKVVTQVIERSESGSSPPHQRVSIELQVPEEVHPTENHDTSTEGQKESVKSFPGAARLMQPTGEAASQPVASNPAQEITENGNRRAYNAEISQEENNNMDHYSAYTGIQYSPLDMAEYIFWTGDEKGVTLAIEEFLQDGLMTREEAIAFLQEIKINMDYLQTHYAQHKLKSAAEQRIQQENQLQDIQLQLEKSQSQNNYHQYEFNNERSPMSPTGKFNHDKILKILTTNTYERNNNLNPGNLPQLPFSLPDLRQDIYKKSVQDNLLQNNYKYTVNVPEQFDRESNPIPEEDYEELTERMRVADAIFTENSLEEVIYQLAKVMFTQSLSRGSSEAQLALQKFTSFLEAEAEQGRISRGMEKKVLDVLIESLTDTLTEHPELVSAARTGLGGGATLPPANKALQQLLEQRPIEHGMMKSGMGGPFNGESLHNKHGQRNIFNQAAWAKTREHTVGENQSKILPMQPVKRFKKSA